MGSKCSALAIPSDLNQAAPRLTHPTTVRRNTTLVFLAIAVPLVLLPLFVAFCKVSRVVDLQKEGRRDNCYYKQICTRCPRNTTRTMTLLMHL